MQVKVDEQACKGYANCVMAVPDLFDLDDRAIAVVLVQDIPEHRRGDAVEGVRSCPAHALSLVEDEA
jgi:ferredoxin